MTLATLTIENRIARLMLNRPEKRNALSLDLLASLHHRVDELKQRENEAPVCIVAGAGPTFCAGLDLKAVLSGEPSGGPGGLGGASGGPAALLSSLAELSLKIRALSQVTIARVVGGAIGGGCGLACVCDIAVTHPEAKVGYPEVDLGICPAVVAPWLIQSVGAGAARRILLQGGTMSGLRAYEIGMFAHCVPSQELDQKIEELALRLAAAGPNALRATKKLLNEIEGPRLAELVREGARISAQVIEGPEARGMLGLKMG